MKKITEEWFKSAEQDLETIKNIISNDSLTGIVAFHAQQTIEKVFKAVLEEYSIEVPKIHKLRTLLNLIPIRDDLQIENTLLDQLDELYIESRYPGELGLLPNGEPGLDDANDFYHFALSMYEKIRKVLAKKKATDEH